MGCGVVRDGVVAGEGADFWVVPAGVHVGLASGRVGVAGLVADARLVAGGRGRIAVGVVGPGVALLASWWSRCGCCLELVEVVVAGGGGRVFGVSGVDVDKVDRCCCQVVL